MAQLIDFVEIPADWQTGGHWQEVDDSEASVGVTSSGGLLLIGPGVLSGLDAGTATVETLTAVGSGQARTLFGHSPLAEMIEVAAKNFAGAKIWAVATDNDDAALTRAEWTVTINGVPTSDGTLAIYFGSRRHQIAVSTTDTTDDIALAIQAAVNDDYAAQFTVSVTGSVVTLTSKARGAIANSLKLDVNRKGSIGGEVLPAGMSAPTIVQTTQGAGVPVLTNALAAIGDADVQGWISAWSDTATLGEIEFALVERWHFTQGVHGHCHAFRSTGTYAGALAYGQAGNENLITAPAAKRMNEPDWMCAAGFGAVHEESFAVNPGISSAFKVVQCLSDPGADNAWSAVEKDALIEEGVAEWHRGEFGEVLTGRPSTRRTKDATGAPNDAWDLTNTVACVEQWAKLTRAKLGSFLVGKMIVNNGEPLSGGNKVTPEDIRTVLILLYKSIQEGDGWVENIAGFVANTIVERDQTNVYRIRIRTAPDFANPFLQLLEQIQFRKQYLFS